jgi:Fe-S oxidoreductase
MYSTSNIIFTIVLFLSFGSFAVRVRRLLAQLLIGKPEDRLDRITERLKKVMTVALGQSKIMRERFAGLLHVLIFWGFLALLIAVVETIGEGLTGRFSFAFLGWFYSVITFSQEWFCVFVMVAIVFSFWRRFVARVPRLQVDAHGRRDAALILAWIFCIVASVLLQNAVRISLSLPAGEHPISSFLAPLFAGSPTAPIWEHFFWWMHIGLVLAFMNYLPGSKHLHILTSIPNVFFSRLGPTGVLTPLDLNDEHAVKFGATDVEDLTWKQLLDGMTCTECGRCHAVCPAAATGKKLSPRRIIVETRHRMSEKAPVLLAHAEAENPDLMAQVLSGAIITEDELWACTTCLACVQECPVLIEHVDEIVDLRRSLVLNESRFPAEVRTTFENLERNGCPWAFNSAARGDWASGLNIKTMAEDSAVEYLFWVGCAGSYDVRYQKVARAFAQLLQHAGVSFAILGAEEKCNGDAARRMGNEYLAQMLMTGNIETLARYNVKKIITTCPHCFHSMKNEYPKFGGNFEVMHHADFLFQLVAEGKIRPSTRMDAKITFHDSCYLARYNQIEASPRSLLETIPGTQLIEMGRHGDRGFCCGAGGGRMFMEEHEGTRINEERTREAIETGAGVIGTACPFCMTMLTDGIKMKGRTDDIVVEDLAELIWRSVSGEAT